MSLLAYLAAFIDWYVTLKSEIHLRIAQVNKASSVNKGVVNGIIVQASLSNLY